MGDSTPIETILPAMLETLTFLLDSGYLRAADLVSLEASSLLFRAPSGLKPYQSLSIAASAARQSCENHPAFAHLPQTQHSALLARCKGNWKLVLHYLKASERRLKSGANKVLIAAGASHSLIVNGKGELYACGRSSCCVGQDPQTREADIAPQRIPLPSASKLIVQISSTFQHAAFVTEIGQVYTFGNNSSCCCGVGESGQAVLQPTLVTSLQGIPCQQVATGNGFTLAVTLAGDVYSWGEGGRGKLGHGDREARFRPQKIEHFDVITSDPVVQVSAGFFHSLAVTKFGQLFTWGDNFGRELRPNRVGDAGFDKLFIESAAAGNGHCAAIDSSGRVYTWGTGTLSALGREDVVRYQHTPLLVDNLNTSRAIQVTARTTTCVLVDTGAIHCFGHLAPRNWGRHWQPSHGRVYMKSYVVDGHNVQSIACGQHHAIVVTEKGSIFAFGSNCSGQLGLLTETQSQLDTTPAEVFTEVLGLE